MTTEQTRAEDLRMDMGALLGAVGSRWLRILLVTVLVLAATLAVLLFMPRLYESRAGLLVEPRLNVLQAPGEQASSSGSITESVMSSQIELIRSRDTLLEVIDRENLRSVPELTGSGFSPVRLVMQLLGRSSAPRSVDETILGNLDDALTVVRERDSAIISVIVRTTDPELSARLANAIANAHVRRRAGLTLADTAEGAAWLEQEIAGLRERVQSAEAAVADYRVENDLLSPLGDESLINQQMANISNQIAAAQERRSAAQSRAELIQRLLDAGQPIEGVAELRDAPVVQQLIQSRATLQAELAQRSSTLLPNHPVIKGLVAQVAETNQQIEREARRIAEALVAEAQVETGVETSLRDELARLRLAASNATQDNVELAALEREARAQRELLESYLARYNRAVSQTDANSALPDVRVVSVAAPAVQPSSPKTTLVLGAVAFVALALQIGGILFGELMSGRALTERRFYRVEHTEDMAPADWVEPHASDAELAAVQAVPAEIDIAGAEEGVAAPLAEDEVQPDAEDEVRSDAEDEDADTFDEETWDESDAWEEDSDTDEAVEEDVALSGDEVLPPPAFAADEREHDLAGLIGDIAAGRMRVVLLASPDGFKECLAVSDQLVAGCLALGMSVCCVDAGSGEPGEGPGLSELSADLVSFGDVVQQVGEGLAEVHWGALPALERRSLKPATLVAALTDVYDVVVVNTGRSGLASTLPMFAGIEGRLLLVGDEAEGGARLAAVRDDAALLGFETVDVTASSLVGRGAV